MGFRNSTGFLPGIFVGAAILFSSATYAADLASQSSEDGGVTIAVKPVEVSAGAAIWSFQVSLSSNSKDLNDDLVRTAYIVNRVRKMNEVPAGWKGDAPGGRERKGVLSFKASAPLPAAIELRIQRAGEKAPRMFRWDLDCPCNDPKMHAS